MSKKSQYKNRVIQRPGRYNVRDVEVAFSYKKQSEDRKRLEKILKIPGKHNVYNALAALTAARALGIDDEISFKALSEFRGAWRRFEKVGEYNGVVVISDYAHNPAKIKALADSLIDEMKKKKQRGKAIIVFQPHHQKRLETLFDDFVEAFGEAASMFQVSQPKAMPTGRQDGPSRAEGFRFQVLITDVYEVAGREKKSKIKNQKSKSSPTKIFAKNLSGQKNSKTLVDAINKKYPDASIIYVPKNQLKKWLKNKFFARGLPIGQAGGSAMGGQFSPKQILRIATGQASSRSKVLCFAGAGDIDDFARKFLTTK